MYLNDKTNRITLRLNDSQFNFVKNSAQLLDQSPSDFLRSVINLTMATANSNKEGTGRENDKANLDRIV